MRVAFTGKGGSGKSTTCALFIDYLQQQGQRVLAVDADINVHLASLLGSESHAGLALSAPDNVISIRQHLLGSNQLIGSADHFVKTTPPGPGSNLLSIADDDPIVSQFSTKVAPSVNLMHVGTYDADGIGTSCYHVNLGILENVLTHIETGADEWVVCDMVAGTDAFSNSLHAQFDAIVVVVEPTPEATSVARMYRELARAAGVEDTLVVIGNKTADSEDMAYLERETDGAVLATIALQPGLRRARQQGVGPTSNDLPDVSAMQAIQRFAETSPHSADRRRTMLYDIHRRLAEEDWIRSAHGDITRQIPSR